VNPRARDVVTFFLGFAGVVHQTVVAPQPQTILVVAFVSMMFGSAFVGTFLDKWGRGPG
jgi:hypothetical protein